LQHERISVMCHEYAALPPSVPPDLVLTASPQNAPNGQRITLTSADGTPFAAYDARPATGGSGAGIVILPDVRGLFPFYEDLAERFVSAGVAAVTIDFFGRTAGVGARDETFEYMPHVAQTKREQIAQDVSAAIARLRAPGNIRAVFTVGFCFGGGNSLAQAALQPDLAGVIAFYGPPTASRIGPPPIDMINDFTCPVLGFYGAADQGIPVAEVRRFDDALAAAGIEREITIYPDTPHSFFDRTADQHQQQSADAWRRMLAFIAAHTPTATV
jgi:carboxymethylenebutenolidase